MTAYCHDCNCKEGELHKENCDWERCPRCDRQLLSCPNHDWNDLSDEEREPFFAEKPIRCERCDKLMKEFPSMISDELWKKICGVTYDKKGILCQKCIDYVIKIRRKLNGNLL
jgi:hypothetical protein